MKCCTYCGREYPENVLLCPVDHNAVTEGGKPIPPQREPRKRARTKLEIRAHLLARPAAVSFGIGLLALSVLVDAVREKVFQRQHTNHNPRFYVISLWPIGASLL